MKTSAKVFIGAAAGFIAGCAFGLFLPSLETSAGSAKGDIAKVSKFSRDVVGSGLSAVEEELKNNPEQLARTKATLNFLTGRMAEFDDLVEIAVAASGDTEELSSSVGELQKVQKLAQNAKISGEMAVEALEAVSNGDRSEIDYEQASQNLTVAFLLVDRQVSVGKQYVCDVDAYLRNRNTDDYMDLAFARDLWANYCSVEAAINDDKNELAYWSKQNSLVSDVKGALAGMSEVTKVPIDAALLKGFEMQEMFKTKDCDFLKGYEGLRSIEEAGRLGSVQEMKASFSNSESLREGLGDLVKASSSLTTITMSGNPIER